MPVLESSAFPSSEKCIHAAPDSHNAVRVSRSRATETLFPVG
jgi:hypothetical protein